MDAAATDPVKGSVIELREIHKVYTTGGGQEVHALRGVSLDFIEGGSVALMGSSGSGKSTMMNILGCLDRPSSGLFSLDGIDVSGLSREQLAELRNERLGFVFQNFHLLARTSALENVEMPMLYHRAPLSTRQMRERALEALDRVGLADRAGHLPNQLSGGQQQRVAIARALVNQPRILLADEPTGNLDSSTTLDVMQLFQELITEGLTVILVTHEPELCRFLRRTLVLQDGRIIQDQHRDTTQSAVEAKQAYIAANDSETKEAL
ncbi:MAG: ABC transporter ATP-binding protein [Puniceicoccaceae bacterium]|nr:MAG: ABC transporter ATP-binding protein [Puniceicoccaceae bacterium]